MRPALVERTAYLPTPQLTVRVTAQRRGPIELEYRLRRAELRRDALNWQVVGGFERTPDQPVQCRASVRAREKRVGRPDRADSARALAATDDLSHPSGGALSVELAPGLRLSEAAYRRHGSFVDSGARTLPEVRMALITDYEFYIALVQLSCDGLTPPRGQPAMSAPKNGYPRRRAIACCDVFSVLTAARQDQARWRRYRGDLTAMLRSGT